MIATTSILALAAAGLAWAQSPTDEASAAQSTNPVTECAPYSYAPVAALVPSYPTVWHQPADIPSSDTEAQNLYNSIAPNIPNFPVRGNYSGSQSGFSNYTAADPACWWTYTKCTKPKTAGIPTDVSYCPENNVWGYTFDDGPNCSHNAFYDYLQSQNQKATMFYIGSNIMNHPLEAMRGLADGHEICAHTWSHPYMTGLTNSQIFAELYYSKKVIKDVLGITVQCWRPPYGDVDDRVRYIANELGMATIIWLQDTFDWEHATIGESQVDANYQALINFGKTNAYTNGTGPIVLSHEIDNTTMVLAQQFYPQIKQAYSHVVPVAVCWNITEPYMESQFKYPSFDQYIAGTTTISSYSAPTPTLADVSIVAAGDAGPYTATGSAKSSGGGKPGASGSSGSDSGAGSLHVAPLVAMAMTAVGVVAGAGWVGGMMF